MADVGDRRQSGQAAPQRLRGRVTPPSTAPVRPSAPSFEREDDHRSRVGWVGVACALGAITVSPWALALLVAMLAGVAADGVIRARRPPHEPEVMIDLTHVDLRHDEPVFGGHVPLEAGSAAARWTDNGRWGLLVSEAGQVVGDASRLSVVLGAAGLPLLAASEGVRAVALALPLLIVGPFLTRMWMSAGTAEPAGGTGAPTVPRPNPALAELGMVVIASLVFGLAAAAMVLVTRLDETTAVVLVLVVGAYDLGNHLIGSGAGSWWEGPASGVAAAGVIGFAAWVVVGNTVGDGAMIALVASVALLSPPGPALVNVLFGDGRRPAGEARRLDAFVCSVPIAAYVVAALAP